MIDISLDFCLAQYRPFEFELLLQSSFQTKRELRKTLFLLLKRELRFVKVHLWMELCLPLLHVLYQ